MEERIGVSHERSGVRDLNPTRNFLLSLNMDLKVQMFLTNSLKLALLKTGSQILGAASRICPKIWSMPKVGLPNLGSAQWSSPLLLHVLGGSCTCTFTPRSYAKYHVLD